MGAAVSGRNGFWPALWAAVSGPGGGVATRPDNERRDEPVDEHLDDRPGPSAGEHLDDHPARRGH